MFFSKKRVNWGEIERLYSSEIEIGQVEISVKNLGSVSDQNMFGIFRYYRGSTGSTELVLYVGTEESFAEH